jgi:uncharacterized protein YndB with AHSA1/START domain
MPILKLTQVIDRPAERVFATIIDAGQFADWNPTIKGSRQLTDGAPGEGSRFEWDLAGFGKVEQELQEFEPNRRVRIVPHIRTLAGGHRFNLTPEGARTRVDHELEMIPKGWFRLMGPMMAMMGRRNLKATADALKRHLETTAT